MDPDRTAILILDYCDPADLDPVEAFQVALDLADWIRGGGWIPEALPDVLSALGSLHGNYKRATLGTGALSALELALQHRRIWPDYHGGETWPGPGYGAILRAQVTRARTVADGG